MRTTVIPNRRILEEVSWGDAGNPAVGDGSAEFVLRVLRVFDDNSYSEALILTVKYRSEPQPALCQ